LSSATRTNVFSWVFAHRPAFLWASRPVTSFGMRSEPLSSAISASSMTASTRRSEASSRCPPSAYEVVKLAAPAVSETRFIAWRTIALRSATASAAPVMVPSSQPLASSGSFSTVASLSSRLALATSTSPISLRVYSANAEIDQRTSLG
jgi:hypothetical protein